MGLWIDLLVRQLDDARLVDHVADATGVALVGVAGRVIRHPDSPIRVAEKRIGKVELLGERLVVFRAIEADAQYLEARRANLIDSVA